MVIIKYLTILFVLISVIVYGQSIVFDSHLTFGPGFAPMQRGAAGVVPVYPGDWTRDDLCSELVLENLVLNGSGVSLWRNTSGTGSKYDYAQSTAVNQPVVGSGSIGVWFSNSSTLTSTNHEYGDGVGITRYYAMGVPSTISSSFKYPLYQIAGGNDSLYFYNNGFRELGYSATAGFIEANFAPGISGKTLIITGQKGPITGGFASVTITINGNTYTASHDKMDCLPYEDSNVVGGEGTKVMGRIHASPYNMFWMYVYLSYRVPHSASQRLEVIGKINEYLAKKGIATATIY